MPSPSKGTAFFGATLRQTSATYTLTGKIATATDANNNYPPTRYAYDADDRLAGTTDSLGRQTIYGDYGDSALN